MNVKKIDYSVAYNDFWSRVDRMGSESYEDRNDLVDQIISTIGYGRVLDVGCGEGRLVRALVEKGVDAYGVDVSSVAIARANQFCPERFQCASVLDLPFADKHFDAIISTDCLEHIHPDDVPAAIAELRRICNQYAFFTIATTNDRDGHWHLTVKPREWWEEKFFEAGFIRHPEYYKINPLKQISSLPWQITVPLSTVRGSLESQAVSPRYLSESSEAADIFLSCYTDIAGFARPGDIVFHIGASSTDFAFLLNFNAECKEIHVFLDEKVKIEIASDNLKYANIFIYNWKDLSDRFFEYSGKIDLVVIEPSFNEAVWPLPLHKAIVPGGRAIILSTTEDKSIDSFGVQLDEVFKIEEIRNIEFLSHRISYAVFLSPFSCSHKEFIPRIHGYTSPPENLINFSRDYSNPWLPQNLVVPGIRTSNKDILISESNLILSRGDLESTPDFGAALCVKGYRLLEQETTEDAVTPFISRIDDYLNTIESNNCNPHGLRWIVSLRYLQAKLYLKVGDLESALASFSAVISQNALGFSPTLMTKSISSCIIIGDVSLGFNKIEDAAAAYEKGARSGFEALKAPMPEWVGKWELPIKGAMYEATQIADLTNVCLLKLRALKLSSEFSHPVLRVFQEGNDSVFAVNTKRYAIIEKQDSRLMELASAIDAQARMLEERWSIMQSMEGLIRDRDDVIASQARMLEERWLAMQSMEGLIRERDDVITNQTLMLEKRATITEAMTALLSAVIASLRYRFGKVLGRGR